MTDQTAGGHQPAAPPPAHEATPAAPAVAPVARRRRRKLARIAVALLVLAVICEVVLRLGWGFGDPLLFRKDPDCGYLPAPLQDIRRLSCRNIINAFGMRSAEVAREKPAGTLRLLCVGDSVTYGTTYVDQSQIFPTILARQLPQTLGRPVEVLNASVGGWAVGNEWGYLRSRGTFGADLVLFVLNPEDLTQAFNQPPFGLSHGLPERKPLLAMQEVWVRYVRPRLACRDVGGENPPSVPPDVAPASGPAIDEALQANCLTPLEQARHAVRAAGGNFAVLYSPGNDPSLATPAFARRFDALHEWCRRRGVPLIDVTAAYQRHPAGEIFLDAVHLRPGGQAVVAQEILAHWPQLMAPQPAGEGGMK